MSILLAFFKYDHTRLPSNSVLRAFSFRITVTYCSGLGFRGNICGSLPFGLEPCGHCSTPVVMWSFTRLLRVRMASVVNV
eukprot:2997625-Amphidinium_carterae.1